MHFNIKTVFIQMTILGIMFFPICYKPIAAQAMTAEEFVKLFGVVDRYLQDIQRTFPNDLGNPTNPPPSNDPIIPQNPDPEPSFQLP